MLPAFSVQLSVLNSNIREFIFISQVFEGKVQVRFKSLREMSKLSHLPFTPSQADKEKAKTWCQVVVDQLFISHVFKLRSSLKSIC